MGKLLGSATMGGAFKLHYHRDTQKGRFALKWEVLAKRGLGVQAGFEGSKEILGGCLT